MWAVVVAPRRFIYDLWGDTVNIASRLTDEARRGEIAVDKNTYHRLRQQHYLFEPPTTIVVKGKGEMTAYRLTGRSSGAKPSIYEPDAIHNLSGAENNGNLG